jgi:P27 family predicted phage terminase small subunit
VATLWRLAFPLTRPALVTASIYDGLAIWNGFLLPLILIQSPSQRPLPLALWSFQGEYSIDVPAVLASVVLTALPILALYVVGRRQFLSGLTAGFGKRRPPGRRRGHPGAPPERIPQEKAAYEAEPRARTGGRRRRRSPHLAGGVGWTIVEAGSCQDTDALVLERYCQLHDRRAVLLALVGTEGYVVPGAKQPSTAHPAIRLAHDIEAQMTRLESALALNPAARARLGLAAAGDDPPADLLAGA